MLYIDFNGDEAGIQADPNDYYSYPVICNCDACGKQIDLKVDSYKVVVSAIYADGEHDYEQIDVLCDECR